MRSSLLTMYNRPTATADNSTVSRSAAMSVKPRESRLLFPMFSPSDLESPNLGQIADHWQTVVLLL